MACNLFEGLDDDILFPDTEMQDDGPADTPGSSKTVNVGSCGLRQVLLHCGEGPPALLTLTASREQPDLQQPQHTPQQGQQGSDSILLEAASTHISGWEQVSGRSQLLRLCQQPGPSADEQAHPANLGLGCLPSWLLLCKSGSTLQLLVVEDKQEQRTQQQQQQQQQAVVHLLAEFEHVSFQQLEQQQCWLVPGPLLVLQPEPEQQLIIAPIAEAAAAGAASSSAGCSQNWQLLELELPAEQLLACLQQEQLASTVAAGAAGEVPVRANDSNNSWQKHHSSSYTLSCDASGLPRILHCSHSCSTAIAAHDSSSVLLLVSLPVAARTPRGIMGNQQVLLLWLEVQLSSSKLSGSPADLAAGMAVAGAAIGQEACECVPGLRVVCCCATGWQDTPTCAAVLEGCSSSVCGAALAAAAPRQQSIAIGSSSGYVQLLQVTSRQLAAQWRRGQLPQQQQQQQQQQHLTENFCGSSISGGSWACTLQAQAKLPGPVDSITQLAQAFVAGSLQRGVVAVLHGTVGPGPGPGSSAVSLLVQQGGQLQVMAAIQGAVALLAPSCSPVGLLCPCQQQQQQLGKPPGSWPEVDSSCLRLAALVLLEPNTAALAGPQDQAAHTAGLGCYALLPAGKTGKQWPWPGAVLGLLQCLPPGQQAAAAAGAGLLPAGVEPQQQAAGCRLSEVRGLQAMLSALQTRWHQESTDLSALQGRLSQGQRVAAAAHRQLCQLAADMLQGSTARQYCLPLTCVSDPAAAVAAYQTGKQIAQQLRGPQVQRLQDAQQQQQLQQLDVCLVLELVGSSTRLAGDELHFIVQLKPQLQQQCQQQHGRDGVHPPAACAGSSSGSSNGGSNRCWWGPLLQPCHAECVLWHADVAPVTSQSSWQWDAVVGLLTVQASLPLGALLQLVLAGGISSSSNSSIACLGGLGSTWRQPGSVQLAVPVAGAATEAVAAAGVDGGSCDDAYVGAARAMAAAATAAAVCSDSSRSSRACPAECADDTLRLHAAIVAAACCSQQAVAQETSRQLGSAAGPAVAAGGFATPVAACAHLLAPATALMHLPPLEVPAQQLLLRHLARSHAALPTAVQQHFKCGAHVAAAGGVVIAAAAAAAGGGGVAGMGSLAAPPSDSMHTPSRPAAMEQQLLGSIAAGAASMQPTAAGAAGQVSSFAGADIVPPTPYSAVQEDGVQQHEDIVIKDSQESERHVTDSVMRDAAGSAVPAAAAAAAAAQAATTWEGRQQHGWLPSSRHRRQLLLQCESGSHSSSSVLLLLPSVLVQQLDFSAAGGWDAAELVEAVLQLDQQPMRQPVHVVVQLRKEQGVLHGSRTNSGGGCSIGLTWFSGSAVHVELGGCSSQELDVLQQLLLMAMSSLPGGGQGVTCQVSPLGAAACASCVAAIGALSQAVALQCKVLEATLQEVHSRQAAADAGTSAAPHAVAAGQQLCGQENLAPPSTVARGAHSVKRQADTPAEAAAAGDVSADKDRAAACGAAATPAGVTVLAEGRHLGPELSACWLGMYKAAADVDLAIAQLGVQLSI